MAEVVDIPIRIEEWYEHKTLIDPIDRWPQQFAEFPQVEHVRFTSPFFCGEGATAEDAYNLWQQMLCRMVDKQLEREPHQMSLHESVEVVSHVGRRNVSRRYSPFELSHLGFFIEEGPEPLSGYLRRMAPFEHYPVFHHLQLVREFFRGLDHAYDLPRMDEKAVARLAPLVTLEYDPELVCRLAHTSHYQGRYRITFGKLDGPTKTAITLMHELLHVHTWNLAPEPFEKQGHVFWQTYGVPSYNFHQWVEYQAVKLWNEQPWLLARFFAKRRPQPELFDTAALMKKGTLDLELLVELIEAHRVPSRSAVRSAARGPGSSSRPHP